jgi:hypothetical protein
MLRKLGGSGASSFTREAKRVRRGTGFGAVKVDAIEEGEKFGK